MILTKIKGKIQEERSNQDDTKEDLSFLLEVMPLSFSFLIFFCHSLLSRTKLVGQLVFVVDEIAESNRLLIVEPAAPNYADICCRQIVKDIYVQTLDLL